MIVPNDNQGYLNVELKIGKGGRPQERVVLDERLMLPGKWEMALVEMYYELSNSQYIEPKSKQSDRLLELYDWSFFFKFEPAEGMGFVEDEFAKYEKQRFVSQWRAQWKRKENVVKMVTFNQNDIMNGKRTRVTVGDIVNNFNNKFKHPDEKLLRLSNRMGGWTGPPVLSLVGRKVKLTLPPCVKEVHIGQSIGQLLGFSKLGRTIYRGLKLLFERDCIYIPSPYQLSVRAQDGKIHDLSKERYQMVYNTESVTSTHDCDCLAGHGKNIFIYCGQLDYRLVGDVATPLLRFCSLTTRKHHIRYEQFHTLQYYPLLVNDIQHLDFRLIDEKGQDIKFFGTNPTLVLHFRKKVSIT